MLCFSSIAFTMPQSVEWWPKGFQDTIIRDSIRRAKSLRDSILNRDTVALDSILTDTLRGDTLRRDTVPPKPFLDAPIFGSNEDSLVYDVKTNDIYIYKKGDVKYQNVAIQADYIKMNTDTKLVRAKGIMDTVNNVYMRPKFTEATTTYDMDSIIYNMDTQKAIINGVSSKQNEGFMTGGLVKKMKDNVIHMHNGRFTTCDAACPHFYLQMTKGTVIPGKKTVFGPAYMVFEDVPLYILGLPFGFFPQTSSRSSGIIFPEIGEEYIKGFFVRNAGYYFAINDYLDLKLTGGIYTLGSWQAQMSTAYKVRYKFSGSIGVDYAKDVIGEPGAADYINTTNIRIQWSHQQDAKYRPGSTFSASVNYASSTYNKFNAQDMNDYLNSQTNSSIAYSKNWAGTPFSLSINGSLSQNSQDTTMSFSLPQMVFNVSKFSPFKRKKALGKERWYEKISATYQLNFRNEVKIKERELFKPEMFEKMRYGVQHVIPVNASFNLLKYLNVTPGVNYNERWYFRQINQTWDDESKKVIMDTTSGFNRVYDYSASLGMSTKLYGMYTVGRKNPVMIRHVASPNISVSYRPDFGKPQYGYYKSVQVSEDGRTNVYSPYANELFGVPSNGSSGALNFSLGNTLEAKIPSKTDTTGFKKVKIFEQLSISSSYNFLADSMNLAPFTVTAAMPIIPKFTLNVNMAFDPYQTDKTGRRINKFQIAKGGLVRMTALNFSLNYGFQSRQSQSKDNTPSINNPDNKALDAAIQSQQADFFNKDQQRMEAVEQARMIATQYYDFEIPWSVNFGYNFGYTNNGVKTDIMQTVSFNANVNITKKWAASFSAGYDFALNKLTPGTLQITRDLHCWQMSFAWTPVGFRQSWNFSIQAKASVLADVLKYKKDRSFYENYYGQ